METLLLNELFPAIDEAGIKKEIKLLPLAKVQTKDSITGGIKELNFDKETLSEIKKNFDENARGQRIPIELKHTDSGAYGWLKSIYLKEDGLYAEPEYNSKGLQVLSDKEYAYHSPELLFNYLNSVTVKNYKVVLSGITLTNRPVIKEITGVLNGFSENKCNKNREVKFMDSIMPNGVSPVGEETETKEKTIMDILESVGEIEGELQAHPDVLNKGGAPQLRNLLKTFKQYLAKFNKTKEAKTMPNEDNNATVASISMSELEKYKKEIEESFKLQLSEMQKKVDDANKRAEEREAIADERIKLSEEKVRLFEEKSFDKEDEILLSELIRDGKVKPAFKEKVMRQLKAARVTGIVKLSETENYNSYDELRKELQEREVVIKYGEIGTSSTPKKNNSDEVIKLSETYVKDGLNLKDAMQKAKNELKYDFVMSKRAN